MDDAKILLSKNKELRDQWAAVCNQDWFKSILIYCESAMFSSSVTPEQLMGARRFQEILLTITDPAYESPDPIRCGINHGVDTIKKVPQTETKKE